MKMYKAKISLLGVFLAIGPLFAQIIDFNVARPEIMGMTGFKVVTRMHYFSTLEEKKSTAENGDEKFDTSSVTHIPWNVSFIMGLGERVQFGAHYGGDFSMSGRILWFEPKKRKWLPTTILGVRSLFGSQEGTLYGVRGDEKIERYTNEIFLSAVSSFGKSTQMQYGFVVNQRTEGLPFSFFGGFSQNFGDVLHIGYETFHRYDSYHHQFLVNYQVMESMSLTFGITEFQNWLVQGGEFGFHFSPKEVADNGYQSPGISVSMSYKYGKKKVKEPLPKERLKKVEKKNVILEAELKKLNEKISFTQSEIKDLKKARSAAKQLEENRVEELFSMIIGKINSNVPFDPNEIVGLRKKILDMKGQAAKLLKSIVNNPSKDPQLRIQAMIVMGMAQDSEYDDPLVRATQDPSPEIRKEAILALAKGSKKVALENAEIMLEDPDENVVFAAQQTIDFIQGPEKSEEKTEVELDVP